MSKYAWRSVVVLGALGVALGACESSPDGGRDQRRDAGTGGKGDAGMPNGGAGEGGDSGGPGGSGASAGDAGAGAGGVGAEGGEGPAGQRGDAASGGDGNEAGQGGTVAGSAGEGGAGGSPDIGGTGGGGAGFGGAGARGGSAGMGGRGPTCSAERCLEELGANACGSWSCSTTGECVVENPPDAFGRPCVDRDGDGRGFGTGCTCDLDCDDNDAKVTGEKTTPCCRTGSGTRTCKNGAWQACTAGIPASGEACDGEDDDCDGVPDDDLGEFTCGMGVCRASVPACVAGALSTCIPGNPTSSVDGCNELDDDCDGAVDEDCVSCLRVTPNGDDATAVANDGLSAFRNVQPAIDFAAANPDVATRVCVAAGAECGETMTYSGPSDADLTMRNGIDVLGGYESTTWTRCATTRLAPTTGLGVVFPEDVAALTVLDGFAIDRFAAETTAGVTVRGARGVLLSDLRIEDGPPATNSYGVSVTQGGQATVFRSHVDGGRGSNDSVGVRSVGAEVFVEDNCETQSLASGRCDSSCWIRGTLAENSRLAAAVLFDSSPGSRIERSGVCASYDGTSTRHPSGARIVGDATGVVVHGSSISLTGDPGNGSAAAVRLEACRGSAPWIVDNPSILQTGTLTDGFVRGLDATDECHAVIDSNDSIAVRSGAYGIVSGISCNGRCVIVNNALIRTESTGGVTRSFQGTGVRCNGCVKVSRNTIAGVLGVGFHYCESLCRFSATGLFMNGEAIVDRNRISGGCTVDGSATGLSTSGYTRIENNVIVGTSGVCLPGPGLKAPYLVMGLSASGLVDVHSNYIDSGDLGRLEPGGPSLAVTTCTLRGISYGGTTGVFRNNRIRGGIVECRVGSTNSSSAFFEATAETTPAFVENNSLLGNYVDGGTNAPVNTPGSGNTYWCASDGPVLLAGSTCINTGTPTGAPRFDIDGELRDVAPDIGPDEFSN